MKTDSPLMVIAKRLLDYTSRVALRAGGGSKPWPVISAGAFSVYFLAGRLLVASGPKRHESAGVVPWGNTARCGTAVGR
jgi:hypothetical protein